MTEASQAQAMSGDDKREPPQTEKLWKGLRSELLAFLKARGTPEPQAEDILQVAFLRTHMKMSEEGIPEQPRAWLYQVVRHLLIDESRRASSRSRLVESLTHEGDLIEEDKGTSAFDAVATLLPRFIEKLEAPYAEAITLVELRGLSQAEAALRADVSLSCMKSRVQRARSQLLKALKLCCSFDVDARGKLTECRPRSQDGCGGC